ncbi:serine/threonine-protein kinase [Micromonospora sp. NPDC051196]|uniref:serine/threonine-protein kinase n=1 Tax=Micromonospora sp. NPDC051196 TaxID=3155281 RepID=UPI00343F0082
MTATPPGSLPMPIVPGLTDLQVFARGGYATVYRATQISVGREVAVKVENRTLASERDQARFLREARAAGRMSSHPHVVDLFDVGVTIDQHPYLIMELCDGSYAERMRTSPLDAVEARDLGVKIADAIAHSHGAGVLHRDVKPANILYSHFNSAVLADFGLAVVAEMRDASVALEVLTPAYAPPEMFNHSPPSPAVDVYALCATLYAVMHGRPPRWQAERNPSLVTVLEMFHQPIPSLPGVPGDLLDVLRAGMANDPGERPSAAELRDLLANLSLGAPGGYAQDTSFGFGGGRYDTARPPSPYGQPAEVVSADSAERRRRRRWFFGVTGVVALAASAGVGAWAAGGLPSTQPTLPPRPSATGVLRPGCAAVPEALPSGARCAEELECFGPVQVRGQRAEASQVPCDTRHTWESYAQGQLPAALADAGHDEIVADPAVRKVCNEETFRLVSGGRQTTGWNLEVLPPADGDTDRTYRCLAGRGLDGLASPTLTGG